MDRDKEKNKVKKAYDEGFEGAKKTRRKKRRQEGRKGLGSLVINKPTIELVAPPCQ